MVVAWYHFLDWTWFTTLLVLSLGQLLRVRVTGRNKELWGIPQGVTCFPCVHECCFRTIPLFRVGTSNTIIFLYLLDRDCRTDLADPLAAPNPS